MGRAIICYEGTETSSGKHVEIGALHWLDAAPLPIIYNHKIVGTASNIERGELGEISAEVSMDLSNYDINVVVTNVFEHHSDNAECDPIIDYGRIREIVISPSGLLGRTLERSSLWTERLRRLGRLLTGRSAPRSLRSSENFSVDWRTARLLKPRLFGWMGIYVVTRLL